MWLKGWFKFVYVVLTVACVSFLAPTNLFAQSSNSRFFPDSDNIFIIKNKSGAFTCARKTNSSSWQLGYYKNKTGEFTIVKALIKETRKAMKAAKGIKRRNSNKQLNKYLAYEQLGGKVCKSGPPKSSPQPTPAAGNPTPKPTAGATRTPTPRPTNTPRSYCFNGDNTVPELGCFGLPIGVSGNKQRGSLIVPFQCTLCHEEKIGRSYDDLMNAFQRPEMQPFKPSNSQTIYDIIAYLNRHAF